MNPQKLPLPGTGHPKSGLMQFGDEQPGLFITAEDAFVLRLALNVVTEDALPSIPEVIDDDDIHLAADAIGEAVDAVRKISDQLAPLLSKITYGSPSHLRQRRAQAIAPIAAAA